MATYNIFCLVQTPDDDVDELQPIELKIASTETVSALAYLVKTMEPATLGELNLSALKLYQVDALDNATAISRCQPANKLSSIKKLNKIYTSDPPDDMIHIVVKVPRKSVDPRVHVDSTKTAHDAYPLPAANNSPNPDHMSTDAASNEGGFVQIPPSDVVDPNVLFSAMGRGDFGGLDGVTQNSIRQVSWGSQQIAELLNDLTRRRINQLSDEDVRTYSVAIWNTVPILFV